MKKIVTLYLDLDLYDNLQDLKINHHINISSFIASAVKEKLEKENHLQNKLQAVK